MRLAILSDIHGNYEALRKVIIDIKKNKIDAVIFLGDLVMKGPQPQNVFYALKELSPICWLRGNTELWLSSKRSKYETSSSILKEIALYREFALKRLTKENINFMLNCPAQKSLSFENRAILCVHGSPRSIIEALTPSTDVITFKQITRDIKENIILCGHSHIPFIKKIDEKIVFNPGSVGCPYDGNSNSSYGIININSSTTTFCIRRIDYPIKELICVAKKENFPNVSYYENLITMSKKI